MLSALVTLSATVITAWMLFDAIRRRVDTYWYLVILTPLGEWVYFFAIKIHDYDLRRLKKMLLFERPPSADQMRMQLEETPSDENKILLGQALYDAKQYDEALALFEEVLDRDEQDKEALYGAAPRWSSTIRPSPIMSPGSTSPLPTGSSTRSRRRRRSSMGW